MCLQKHDPNSYCGPDYRRQGDDYILGVRVFRHPNPPPSRLRRSAQVKMWFMAGHECYHCKQWIEEGEAHDCWTTTEGALTADLPEDLRDAWERLRESAVEIGDPR